MLLLSSSPRSNKLRSIYFSTYSPIRNKKTVIKNVIDASAPTETVHLTTPPSFKRRNKKYAVSVSGGGGGSGGIPIPFVGNSTNSIIPSNFAISAPSVPDNFVDLFSIYGNILIKEDSNLLFPLNSIEIPFNYPIDENLMKLFQNSTKLWYENSNESESKLMIPSILSINGPSRNCTWELTKHLVKISGKSHLALIPFPMFYELIQTCCKAKNQEKKDAKAFGDYILNNLTSKPDSFSSSSHHKKSMSVNSRVIIQVIEYLFSCLEASLGGVSGRSGERFTLMIDGLEDFLQNRKGGEDAIMKDLNGWASLFESAGRRIILGGRSQNFIEEEVEEEGSHEDESGPANNNNGTSSIITIGKQTGNSPPPSSSSTSPFQVITDFFLKAAGSKSSQPTSPMITNVRIEGNILRISVNGPKTDKRKLLKYSQLIGIDCKKDLFDENLSILKSISNSRWQMNLSLGLKSKFDFPSNHPKVWEKLSEIGRGILVKRKFTRDEFNEVLIFILGKGSENNSFSVENLSEAIESVSQIRHDPTKFSSDDLAHLLTERQISMKSLGKYEKRFINCISTATTQTHFKDISLPNDIVGTLKSLTTLPLTHPELFTQGILKNSLTGVLLFGPPGTGKTMLARAVAQESGAAFLAVNMSNIFDMWVGEGEKNVKGLFRLARKLSPSIIFIDEIDALLERRSSISGRSSRLEIVNEFMSQWDGLSSNLNSGVVVMGATNRPFVLDDAVLRRLPRRLLIDLPDTKTRHEILMNLLKDNLCENELLNELPEISRKMDFYSGSDLKNVAITAALKAAMRIATTTGRKEEMIISKIDFEEAAREVPASLSDQMDSLIELREWNQMYGENKSIGGRLQKKFGFS